MEERVYTHWIVEGELICGEAAEVESEGDIAFGYAKLFGIEDLAEYTSIAWSNLLEKGDEVVHINLIHVLEIADFQDCGTQAVMIDNQEFVESCGYEPHLDRKPKCFPAGGVRPDHITWSEMTTRSGVHITLTLDYLETKRWLFIFQPEHEAFLTKVWQTGDILIVDRQSMKPVYLNDIPTCHLGKLLGMSEAHEQGPNTTRGR